MALGGRDPIEDILLPLLEGLSGRPEAYAQRLEAERRRKEQEDREALAKSQRDEARIEHRASLFKDLAPDDPLNAVNVPESYTGKPTQFSDVSEMESIPETPSSRTPGQLDRVRNLFSRLEGTDPFLAMQEARDIGGAMRAQEDAAFQRETDQIGQRTVALAPAQAEAANIQEAGTREEQLKTRAAASEQDLIYDIEAHKKRERISDSFARGRMKYQQSLSGDLGEVPRRTAQFAQNKANFIVRANQGKIQGAEARGEDPEAIVEDIVNYVLEQGRKEGVEIPLDVAQGVASEALQQFPGLVFDEPNDAEPKTPSARLDGIGAEKSGRR